MIDLFGAGDGKPPIPPVRAEIIGDFSATGRRFVARFVVFRHPLMVRPLAHGGRTVSLIKRHLSLDLQKRCYFRRAARITRDGVRMGPT